MTIAVLTLVAGRHGHLRRLLAGLDRQTVAADDVVVVDLLGDDELPALIGGRARRLVHPSPTAAHLDLAGARNAAAASTTCDQLVFLDVDILPAPDVVERYGAVLTAHPGAIACGPVRYLGEGWDNEAVGADPGELDRLSEAPSARPVPTSEVRCTMDHELFWSLSFGVTRPTWKRLGGFDTGYRGYGAEDTDLAFRARRLDVPLAWFAGGVGYHQWHPPTRWQPDHLEDLVANAHRFHRRWGSWPMTGWLEELQRLGRVRFDPAGDVLEVAS